ncbi:MAG: hypothetical protein V1845_03060 [bacterium]
MIPLYVLVAANIIFLAAAELLLKKGMAVQGAMDISFANLWNAFLLIFKNFYILGGLALLVFGFVTWLLTLSRLNLNIIYPITASLNLIAIVIASSVIFKESLNFAQILGVALIIGGIFLLTKP